MSTNRQEITARTESPPAASFNVPGPLLNKLAGRFRGCGLCVAFLSLDGTVMWQDTAAAPVLLRYGMNRLASPAGHGAVAAGFKGINASSGVIHWNLVPGIAAAGFAFIERRHVCGVLLLLGKSTTFRLGEEVVQICNQLGIDGIWLSQQCEELPAYSPEAITRQGHLLLESVRDQVRLGGLEQELTSISSQLTNTYEELSLIYQISGGMRINRRPADFFKQACLDSIEVMGVRGIGVALSSADRLGLEPVLYGPFGMAPDKLNRLSCELRNWMIHRKTSLLINDLASDRYFGWLGDYGQRLLAVPLQRADEVLGCLFALDKENGDFDSVDSKLLNSIANESAIYLENAILFEDVHGLMMGLLHSLTSAVDAKDAYTCGHSERVALVSKMLAKEAGLTEAQIERIYMAGLLHDVGKIGVSEAVLQKPGRLTQEEFEQMKKHPTIGARILQDVKQIQDIIPGVLHHHERYDGRGYPDGLSGQQIPLMGRIICLADCFDAMTSTRTYRKALPLEVTLAELRRCSGTHFDPSLTEAFMRIPLDSLRELLRSQEAVARVDLRRVSSIPTPTVIGVPPAIMPATVPAAAAPMNSTPKAA